MDKWELIEITLDQLISQWRVNKDQFDIDLDDNQIHLDNDRQHMSVLWSPIDINDASKDNKSATDSIKMRKGIMISYSKGEAFQCFIYRVDNKGVKPTENSVAENSIRAKKSFTPIRSLYRKFMRLRSDIIAHKRHKANSSYLTNLCGVFPGTLDEHILGSVDGEEDKK